MKYFLFGKEARIQYDNYGVEGVVKNLDASDYDEIKFKNFEDPETVLEYFDGWTDYTLITKEDFDILRKRREIENAKNL